MAYQVWAFTQAGAKAAGSNITVRLKFVRVN